MKEKTLFGLLSIISAFLNFMLIFVLHEGTMLFLTIPMLVSFTHYYLTEE